MSKNLSPKSILSSFKSNSLTSLLTETLMLAKEYENSEFESWLKLELNGYYASNPELKEETVIPEYRSVGGQYYDIYDRPFVIDDPKLQFIQENRLRNSVPELEKLSQSEKMLTLSDPSFLSIIKEQLRVEVHQFRFSPASIEGVLIAIKTRLSDYLSEIEKTQKVKISDFNNVKNDVISSSWSSEMEANIWESIEQNYSISKKAFGKRIGFIKDRFKRRVIFRDVGQAYYLANNDFSKPAIILSGSVC